LSLDLFSLCAYCLDVANDGDTDQGDRDHEQKADRAHSCRRRGGVLMGSFTLDDLLGLMVIIIIFVTLAIL
jgi:hypothetical protein